MLNRLIVMLLCMMFVLSCGGSNSLRRADELEKRHNELTERVKRLEDQLLAAEKKLIAHEQAMQGLNSRQREMENYFNKLQVSQGR